MLSIFYTAHIYIWSFETSVLYNCVYFPFILVNNLMMAILAKICFWLYDKQNKVVVFGMNISFLTKANIKPNST